VGCMSVPFRLAAVGVCSRWAVEIRPSPVGKLCRADQYTTLSLVIAVLSRVSVEDASCLPCAPQCRAAAMQSNVASR